MRTRVSSGAVLSGAVLSMGALVSMLVMPAAAEASPNDEIKTYSQPGTFHIKVPTDVQTIMFAAVGGGGGGGGGGDALGGLGGAGGGGGGGASVTVCYYSKLPGYAWDVTVGAGGTGHYHDGTDGGDTTIRTPDPFGEGPGFVRVKATHGGRATEGVKAVKIGSGGSGGSTGSDACWDYNGALRTSRKLPGSRGQDGSGVARGGRGGFGGDAGGKLKACSAAGRGGPGGNGGDNGAAGNPTGHDGLNGQSGCIVMVINPSTTTVDDLFEGH